MNAGEPAQILSVDAVSHSFGPRQVLKAVSLEVREGEIYALLGPNGAGKTTLVRVVCGRLKPNSGTVRIGGADPFRDPAARAALGLAPQALALYPLLTVAENLEAFARLAGLRGRDAFEAARRAMALTRLDDRARTQVRHLSGGLQRRANIAAAVLSKPRLLILDEPTVGIDLAAREAIGEALRRLKGEGVGVLIVTHDLDQAETLADRAGFLRDGAKVLEGEPSALIARAFGDQMEVEVILKGIADDAAALRLGAEGLGPGREAGTWACFDRDGLGRAAELAHRLSAIGLEVREIRVRRPSLAHLVGLVSEPEAAA